MHGCLSFAGAGFPASVQSISPLLGPCHLSPCSLGLRAPRCLLLFASRRVITIVRARRGARVGAAHVAGWSGGGDLVVVGAVKTDKVDFAILALLGLRGHMRVACVRLDLCFAYSCALRGVPFFPPPLPLYTVCLFSVRVGGCVPLVRSALRSDR